MAGSANSYYGHRAILARYVGLRRERPIFGYMQHGWHHGWCEWLGDELHYARLPRAIPKLMWSEADAEALRRFGVEPVLAVGAPFLYLLRLRGVAPPAGDGSLLCFPYHASEVGSHDTSWASYADYLRRPTAEGRRVTICLHPAEYADRRVTDLLRASGFEVTTNGPREDRRFLERLAGLVEGHDEVTSNRLGTALVYGGAMGRGISLGGPVPGMTIDSHGRPADGEAQTMDRFQRERFPALLDGLGPEQAESFARRELGADQMLAPEELAAALGWRGPRRIKAHGLAVAAALRRKFRPDS